jgi:hypothetical protein
LCPGQRKDRQIVSTPHCQQEISSDVNKDFNAKAKAKAKTWTLKAKAKAKT